VQETP
jgi:hypothetical protein